MKKSVFQWSLVVWTLGIWGSRIRNIVADDELTSSERAVGFFVAAALIASALALGFCLVRSAPWTRLAVGTLALLGVLRFTIRGPFILLDDQWETGFKVVHTILWAVTVVLSVLAWRERRRSETS